MDKVIYAKFREHSIVFPENKFGYNYIPALEYEKNAKIKDDDKYKSLVEPYPHLNFKDNIAIIKEEPDVDFPWTIEMVRKTESYKNGEIWEEGDEQVEAKRVASGIPSYLKPEDFNDNYKDYQKIYKYLTFKFKGQSIEDCHEMENALKDTIKRFRIVNVAMPEYKQDVPKFAKLLEAKRVEVESIVEDLFTD